MFEALFTLTTIDTGTGVARFLLQEFGGRFIKPMERTDWLPGNLVTSAAVVLMWGWFIWTGNISTIWPMFGTANQLLAGIALMVATSALVNAGKARYAWCTALPMAFVFVVTLAACWGNLFDNYLPLAVEHPEKATVAYMNAIITVLIALCAILTLAESSWRWYKVLVLKRYTVEGRDVPARPGFAPPA